MIAGEVRTRFFFLSLSHTHIHTNTHTHLHTLTSEKKDAKSGKDNLSEIGKSFFDEQKIVYWKWLKFDATFVDLSRDDLGCW